MTVVFFSDKGDVAIFLGLSVILFNNLFSGRMKMGLKDKDREWYEYIAAQFFPAFMVEQNLHIYLFPVVWTIIYTLLLTGMAIFYRHFPYPSTDWELDAVTLIFLFNIIVNKMWNYVFFEKRKTGIAMFMTIFLILSGGALIGIFASFNYIASVACFTIYVAWCFIALLINYQFYRYEKKMAKDKYESAAFLSKSPLNTPYGL